MPYRPDDNWADRERQAYGQGYRAFVEGASASDVYDSTLGQQYWFAGFLDAMCEMSVLARPRDVHPDLRAAADNVVGTNTEPEDIAPLSMAEVDRLREALRLCRLAASGDVPTIQKHGHPKDHEIDLASASYAVRVRAVGYIASRALEPQQEPVQQVAPQERALDIGD